jgi:hypothetical protein
MPETDLELDERSFNRDEPPSADGSIAFGRIVVLIWGSYE